MNLIEQLGGYQKAKDYLDALEKIPMHEQTEDTITWLPNALLEYRRANNIFEVGERVVYINGETDGWVNKLSLFTVVSVIGDVLRIKDIDPDFGYLDIFDYNHIFRHATDQEIKAGHRL